VVKPERFCVVSMMRNEGPFVLEWVAHYKALGFDDIVVCTNDCEDTTAELLLVLQDHGLVRHHATIKPAKGVLQIAAIEQALEYNEARQASWVFVCDADEFLNIKISDGSARALVAASELDADGIWVPWRVFGANGTYRFCDAPVKAQFLMAQRLPPASPVVGNWGKSFHRRASSEKISFVGAHKPNGRKDCSAGFRINLPGGQPYAQNDTRSSIRPSYDLAQINHYALRSLDSYLVKRARGSAFTINEVAYLEYWSCFDRNGYPDDSIGRYDEGAARWMDLFRKDARLMQLHQASVDWYERKAAALRADAEMQELEKRVRESDLIRGQRHNA
jgi:hypothetical protein